MVGLSRAPRRRAAVVVPIVAVSLVGLLLFGCSNGASESASSRSAPQPIDAVLAEGELGRSVASGPVPSDQAYWSGVPVPELASGDPYVIDSVVARSIDAGDARVRVGVTLVAPLGSAPEPPNAYRFAAYPYAVRAGDDSSFVSIAIELNGEETATVQGVEIDATLDDGRLVRMVLPVAVAACAAEAVDAAAQCADIGGATYELMGDDPEAWGVFDR